jgi:hypothetical protein
MLSSTSSLPTAITIDTRYRSCCPWLPDPSLPSPIFFLINIIFLKKMNFFKEQYLEFWNLVDWIVKIRWYAF